MWVIGKDFSTHLVMLLHLWRWRSPISISGEQYVYVLLAQSFLALCDPVDHSPPGFSVQVNRVLEKTCFSLTQLYLKSPRVASYSGTSALLFKCSGIACCIVILVYSIFLKESMRVCYKDLESCIFSSPKRERGKVWHWIALLWYVMTKGS